MSKDGRTVSVGQKVRVYRNLNKIDFYSIQDYKTKVVLGYAKSVTIGGGVQFSVSEASRQRVLRDKRRNVHAFAVGLLQATRDRHPGRNATGLLQPLYHAAVHQRGIRRFDSEKRYGTLPRVQSVLQMMGGGAIPRYYRLREPENPEHIAKERVYDVYEYGLQGRIPGGG